MTDELMAFQIALLNSPMLKREMFEQVKECTKQHGLTVVMCMNGLDKIYDSVVVTRKFYQVPNITFGIVPISLMGSDLRNALRRVVNSERGTLSILFIKPDFEKVLILTYQEKDDEIFTSLACASSAYKPDPVIVMWSVHYNCKQHPNGCFENLKMCSNCGSKNTLSVCSNCKGVYYCSKYCQKEDWSEHKEDCPKLKQLCVPRLKWFK